RESVFELVELTDRGLVVRVDEPDDIAARDDTGFPDTTPLAEPFGMSDHPQSRIPSRQGAHELPGAVVSIRRDDHLEVIRLGFEIGAHLSKRRRNAPDFIVRRHDNADT